MTVTTAYANELIFTLDATSIQCQVTGWQLDLTTGTQNTIRTACPEGSVDIPDPNADGIGKLTIDGLADWSDAGWTFLLAGQPREVIPFTLNVDTDQPTQARTYTGTLRVPNEKWEWGPVGQVQQVSVEFAVQTITGPARYVP